MKQLKSTAVTTVPIAIGIAFMFLFSSAYADKTHGVNDNSGKTSSPQSVSAGCVPPSTGLELSLNNVKTVIYTGADKWWDLIGNARYEVPKGSGKHSLYTGSLWMGGVDVNNQLKVAAIRFRQVGNDFWPGPLTTDGAASIDADVCAQYDKFFKITRAEVDEFVGWYSLMSDPALQAELFPGYTIPASILNWPAHGDVTLGQDYYLAPFYDADGSGDYNPETGGDYPKYDLTGEVDCRTTRDIRLFGDETLWWVFNDKGNIHTETGADAIGMEIRSQAFAFATNDEINNMTFYNYELINRGSFTLTNTYFAQWVDPDLGFANDDFVGCDVMRGLGYCYNGVAVDGSGGPQHYGANPPAVGIDFFEGPYQDNDGIDNAKGIGPNEALNGLGYGDGIIDNERFGMRRFIYHNNSGGGGNPSQTDPSTGTDYYNYLRGIWLDNTVMCYGGSGHPSGGGNSSVPAQFMFPGDTDPLGWGTNGNIQAAWTEESAGNVPYDRRFMQSAGPFTLDPGAVNDITVGAVWARATSGGAFASVDKLRLVDDKAQALFQNCFKVLNGPDAPDVSIIELDKELIIAISNRPTSNNYNEGYEEIDPFIISPPGESYDSIFRFEGYQIFQVLDATVSVADLHDPDKARLVAQCDVENADAFGNPIDQLVNFEFSDDLNANIPTEEVNGENKGIRHTFQILNDEFATGDRRLVNHKKYYYIAIAYAYNNYKNYDQSDPLQLDGQKKPYKAGRKSVTGAIKVNTGIPHINSPQSGGTNLNSVYGTGPKLKRIEGTGNGGNAADFTAETVTEILANGRAENPVYTNGRGPVDIKIYNPLNVPNANFTFKMLDSTGGNLDDAYWSLKNEDSGEQEVFSTSTIDYENEQLIPDWGMSLTVKQALEPDDDEANGSEYIESSVNFVNDREIWLSSVTDADGASSLNWIRSGSASDDANPENNDYGDAGQTYEQILGGTWAPYKLASHEDGFASPTWKKFKVLNSLSNLHSVDVVITADKTKWTRSPVIEVADDGLPTIAGSRKMDLRQSPSVDQDGNPDGSGTLGMGWFPGYAVNIETGERLNIMFGENSFLAQDRGTDMIWNPTSHTRDFLNTYFGGGHYIYIMGHNGDTDNDAPAYDEGAWIHQRLSGNNYTPSDIDKRNVYKDVMWVNMPLGVDNKALLATEVTYKIRVTRPYRKGFNNATWETGSPQNGNLPMYTFSTGDLFTVNDDLTAATDALDLINVVPNPYYAYSGYEANQLQTTVKITNLPQKCVVSIYTVNGMLIRQFKKDEPRTSIDWDLKNTTGIPIAGGVYLIHIDVEGVGEKVIKFFGALRPVDLDSF